MRCILITICLFSVHQAVAIDIIAHRGYSCRAPENTVGSVNDAWLAQADGVELDLRVSKDGVVFLHHDDDIRGRLISKLNYAEISSIDETAVPSFESILNVGTPPGYFVLDLKEEKPDKYESLSALIARSGIEPSHFVIQSTSIATLMTVKKRLPDAKYYFVSNLKRRFPFYLTPRPKRVVSRLENFKIDGVSLKGHDFIDRSFVQEIKEAGYLVNIWTINDPARTSYYRDIGVDGLITDFVEQVRSEVVDGRRFEGRCLDEVQDDGY